MAVPKHRTSVSKRNMRRSHDALTAPSLSICDNCQEVKPSHVACKACGFHKGRQVMQATTVNLAWDGSGLENHEHDHDHGAEGHKH
jgi:large subunit ribosomal protein L32